MKNKINSAVIGVGNQGWYHAYKLKNYERSNLIAVCDIKEDVAEKVGKEFGVNYYTDYKEMIKKENIEAISVSTPDYAHRDPVVDCLDAGINVIVQKPFATKFQDAKDMVNSAKKSGKLLVTDYINRWNPEFYLIKEAINNGEIGEPKLFYFRGINSKFFPLGEKPGSCRWAEKTSLVGWLGSHFIDQTLWLSGAKVERVYACSRKGVLKDLGKDVNDFYQIILELDNGAVSVIGLDWIMSETMLTWAGGSGEVMGSKGSMKCILAGEGSVQKYTESDAKFIDVITVQKVRGKIHSFMIEVVAYFINCLYENKKPDITPEDGLECVRVMEAIEKSAKERRIVNLEEIK